MKILVFSHIILVVIIVLKKAKVKSKQKQRKHDKNGLKRVCDHLKWQKLKKFCQSGDVLTQGRLMIVQFNKYWCFVNFIKAEMPTRNGFK